jgi:UDP-N-acetylglucosamine/UDP-N-acetylgalactosamine 4-epimerase
MPYALVTGGAGFIGSHLVRNLLANGWQVRVLDNFATGKKENLAGLSGRLEVLEGDLRDAAIVKESVKGVDVIFHEAAFVSVPQSMGHPDECFDINVRGTEILLKSGRDAGVRRTVIASSAAVYGDADVLPLSEDLPTRCLSPYAASKNINEIMAGMFTRAYGYEVTCLRYFNVFGPRQRPDSQYAAAIPLFIKRCLENQPITIFGDGGQTRDLIFVEDVVRANLIAAEHKEAPGKVFNVCTGCETRILDLVQELQGLFPGAPEPIFASPRAGDIYRSAGSPMKASTELGYRAGSSLAEGLKATVAWMRS